MIRWALPAVALAACRPQPIASCADDLGGVYDVAGESWMIVDGGKQLEAFPLFRDVPVVPGVEVAPRFYELARAADQLTGTLHRRYMQRSAVCDGQTAVHVIACAADTLDIVVADPVPPVGFAPCAWGRPSPSQRLRWSKIR